MIKQGRSKLYTICKRGNNARAALDPLESAIGPKHRSLTRFIHGMYVIIFSNSGTWKISLNNSISISTTQTGTYILVNVIYSLGSLKYLKSILKIYKSFWNIDSISIFSSR